MVTLSLKLFSEFSGVLNLLSSYLALWFPCTHLESGQISVTLKITLTHTNTHLPIKKQIYSLNGTLAGVTVSPLSVLSIRWTASPPKADRL